MMRSHSHSFPVENLRIPTSAVHLGIVALLACGGDSSSPTEPPTPGDPPTVSAVVLGGVSSGNVPLPLTVRVTVGGDSLARLLVLFEGQTDTVTPISALVFDVKDTVRAVGAHSATVILQSVAGRADTAALAVTGTNPLPVITGATLSADSTEVIDSVCLRVMAHDNRGGVSVVTEFEGVRDSTYSPDTILTRDRWLRRGTAGSVPVQVRVRDADGGLTEVGRSARFFVIQPFAELRVPVRADTAPLVIAATVLLHRATVAYDSVRIEVGNGKSELFTGLGRVDSMAVIDTLTEIGVTEVTARWYHPSGTALLKDSVEVLLTPNLPPTGTLLALDDTINEGVGARYQLTFSDDRGVRETRLYRVANGDRGLLVTLPHGNSLVGDTTVTVVLRPGESDTLEALTEDRDGRTDTTRAAPVYTDRRPVITAATLSPGTVVYRSDATLSATLAVVDEHPAGLVCELTTTDGRSAEGGLGVAVGISNPSAAADSAHVSAGATCTDLRGQVSDTVTTNVVTILHADSTDFWVFRADSLLPTEISLLIDGQSVRSPGGTYRHWSRGGGTVPVTIGSPARFAVRQNGAQVGTPQAAPNAVTVLLGAGAVKIGFIPDNPEFRELLERLSLLTANDTVAIRSLFPNNSRDADITLSGHQIKYVPVDPLSDVVPDSSRLAEMASAVAQVLTELREFAVDGRFVDLQPNPPTTGPTDSLYIRWNGPNTYGFGYSDPSPSPMGTSTLNARRVQYPPGGNIVHSQACTFEAHVFNALFARGFYLNEESVLPIGQAGLYEYLANNDGCHLTDLAKRLSGIRSWFGSYTFYVK